MKQPRNIHDALRHLHNLTMSIGTDLENYLVDENPMLNFSTEYFESIKDAALDANMLVTWIKDNMKGESK